MRTGLLGNESAWAVAAASESAAAVKRLRRALLKTGMWNAFLAMQIGGARIAASGGGVMVFIASASALTGAPFHAPYGAAKAGLIALVKSAAVELAPSKIRVNAVAPGPIFTPRMEVLMNEELRAANRANVPLGRMGLPADIAAALLFLASPLSAYITGQTLSVDGGVAAKFPYPTP